MNEGGGTKKKRVSITQSAQTKEIDSETGTIEVHQGFSLLELFPCSEVELLCSSGFEH